MSNSHSQRNATELARLKKIAWSFAEEQAARPAGNSGRTVGGVLRHLAFWDLRATRLLRRWKTKTIGPSVIDVDAANDAMRPLLNGPALRAVVRLTVASAEEIDGEIDSLDPQMLSRIEAEGKSVYPDRATRRIHRLEQIEKAIR